MPYHRALLLRLLFRPGRSTYFPRHVQARHARHARHHVVSGKVDDCLGIQTYRLLGRAIRSHYFLHKRLDYTATSEGEHQI